MTTIETRIKDNPMFRTLFRPRPRMSKALRDELHSLCHASQIEALGQSRHMRRDVGLDCGCDRPESTLPPAP